MFESSHESYYMSKVRGRQLYLEHQRGRFVPGEVFLWLKQKIKRGKKKESHTDYLVDVVCGEVNQS